jgi:hypothetical protein
VTEIRRYGRVYVAPSRIHGEGTFAAESIKEGERIFETDDSNVVPKGISFEEVEREHRHRCDDIAGGKKVILGEPDGCINHSCNPNVIRTTVAGLRCEIAIRDIAPGEELTHDYCINGSGNTVWQCRCGSERCRRTIHSDFFHLPLDLQLEYFRDSWMTGLSKRIERAWTGCAPQALPE